MIEINNERWGDDEVGFNASQFSSGPAREPECSSDIQVQTGGHPVVVTAQVVKKLRDWVGAQSTVDILREMRCRCDEFIIIIIFYYSQPAARRECNAQQLVMMKMKRWQQWMMMMMRKSNFVEK